MLEHAGSEVLEVSNGREAVSVFCEQSEALAVVLLDVTMPEMDGWEALTQIRAVSSRVPVVLMSGYTDAVKDAPIVGESAPFLRKPFRSAELVDTIRDALDG